MKEIITIVIRYAAFAILMAVCAVSLICILAYYREPTALIPAIICGASFIGSVSLLIGGKE